MRFQLGVAVVVSALGALFAGSGCSSSSNSPAGPADSGSTACSDTVVNILNNNSGVACPADPTTLAPLSYDQAVTYTCASEKLKAGDVQFGPCLDYLVWEVDKDSSGHNFTKCYYDVNTHAFAGLIYADGAQDQCGGSSFTVQGGTVESYCQISGFNGGGATFESCKPVVEAGTD